MIVSATVIPKSIIKENTKLIYDVTSNGEQFQLNLIIQFRKEGINYIWEAGNPINKKGYIFIHNDANKNAITLLNFISFQSEESSNQSFIFISKLMFNNWISNKNLEITLDKSKKIKSTFGNKYSHTHSFEYKNNSSYEFDCITVSDISYDSNKSITFVNDSNFPLIIELNSDWTMKLRKIIDPDK
jgi:hypothetical protein